MTDQTNKEALAAQLRGYHGVPGDEKLKNMSDIELDSLLTSCKNNSVKLAAIKREIHRRKKTWHEKSVGFIVVTIFCGLAVAYLAYRFGWTK